MLTSPHALQQQLAINSTSKIDSFDFGWSGYQVIKTDVKRDDQLHPIISGNKWRKLKYALTEIMTSNCRHIVSFGGGHSNHLHALAYCCHKLNIRFTAIVRGDYSNHLTPTLVDLKAWQSELVFVDKQTYQQRTSADYLQRLKITYPNAVIIPEGGSQTQALAGIGEILAEQPQKYDYVLAPVASGATLAGLIMAAPKTTRVIGIAVLKGQDYLEGLVGELLPKAYDNWQILHQFHCGGYAKSNQELVTFCQHFSHRYQVPIEPVYSGKLFYAFKQLLAENYFHAHSKILLIHTGGLQGARAK